MTKRDARGVVIQGTSVFRAQAGDRLIINAHRVRGVAWDAEIIAVLGEDGGPPFLVRWLDSRRVTWVSPGPDARVEPLEPLP